MHLPRSRRHRTTMAAPPVPIPQAPSINPKPPIIPDSTTTHKSTKKPLRKRPLTKPHSQEVKEDIVVKADNLKGDGGKDERPVTDVPNAVSTK